MGGTTRTRRGFYFTYGHTEKVYMNVTGTLCDRCYNLSVMFSFTFLVFV